VRGADAAWISVARTRRGFPRSPCGPHAGRPRLSERAVAIRSQIDSRVASNARPSHRAARAKISVMLNRSYDAMMGAKNPPLRRARVEPRRKDVRQELSASAAVLGNSIPIEMSDKIRRYRPAVNCLGVERTAARPLSFDQADWPVQCPLWVKSRHRIASASCPLFPSKRTFISAVCSSAKCH
jgi:hypothetical protein